MATIISVIATLTIISSIVTTSGQILFSFGDSNNDPGNKQFLTTETVSATTWAYGKSIDLPSGRWSDGKIVPDLLAEFLGITTGIHPILNTKANFSGGASFAVADATILGSPAETWTLSQQVQKFIQSKGNWTEKQISTAVFVFYIGANDYLAYAKQNQFALNLEASAVVNQVISGLKDSLVALYKAGARKFSMQNLAPLGCLPIVKQDFKTGDGCLTTLNDLAVAHNAKLTTTMQQLAVDYAALTYNVYDYYSSIMRRLADGFHYRYLNTKESCCGIGSHNAFGCAYKNVHSNLCTYQRGYLFFDGRHNAEKTNEAVAHLMFSAGQTVVRPMNVRELWVYPTGMSMLET